MATAVSKSPAWLSKACVCFFSMNEAMFKLAVRTLTHADFLPTLPGQTFKLHIHRSAPCHKSTAGLWENRKQPQKTCGEQLSKCPECCNLYSGQRKGRKQFAIRPDIIPHRREEASGGTLHAPHERSTFPL